MLFFFLLPYFFCITLLISYYLTSFLLCMCFSETGSSSQVLSSCTKSKNCISITLKVSVLRLTLPMFLYLIVFNSLPLISSVTLKVSVLWLTLSHIFIPDYIQFTLPLTLLLFYYVCTSQRVSPHLRIWVLSEIGPCLGTTSHGLLKLILET
jgi:hypothetical protein